jgi:hypothetical protein
LVPSGINEATALEKGAHAGIAYLGGSLKLSNPKISLAKWAYLQPSRCPDGAIALRE